MLTAVRTRKRPLPVPPDEADRVKRFTLDEYHRIVELGILDSGDPFELLNGWIIQKMTINPPHAAAVGRLNRLFNRLLPEAFTLRIQQPVSIPLSDSEPEPDLAVAVGPDERYDRRHPLPRDILLLIEVADTSLALDRGPKLVAYAAARVPTYWIVNLIDGQVEAYTQPRGGKSPAYRTRTDYAPGTDIPVVLKGATVGTVPAGSVLPG